MSTRITALIIVISIAILGFILKCIKVKEIKKRLEGTIVYRNKFIDMMNELSQSGKLNMERYLDLVHDVDKMQVELGTDGVLAQMIDPIRGLTYNNYQVLINFFPELRQTASDFWLLEKRIISQAGICDDAFIRHCGNLERTLEGIQSAIYNPFSCFAYGIREVVSLPVYVLHWCGIISKQRSEKLTHGWIGKLIQNLIVFIGLMGSLATIILGWDQLKNIFIACFR